MKHLLKFGLPALLIALFLSCDEGSNTIFEDIVNDTPINNLNQLGNTTNVLSMTMIGSTYYVATGVIRYRLNTDTTWQTLSLPNNFYVNTVTTDGTNLYAGVVYTDGNGTGDFYQYVPGSGTITKVNLTFNYSNYNYKCIDKVRNFGTAVYATYEMTDSNNKHYYSICSVSGTAGAELGGITAPYAYPITDFVDTGTYVFFVSGTAAYRYQSGAVTPITPPAHTYSAVTYDATQNLVIIGTQDGYILRSTNAAGTAWEAAYGPFTYTSGSTTYNVNFTEFTWVTPTLTPSHFLVGTRGAGFYEIDTGTSLSIARFGGSSYADLYNGAVVSFFTDASAGPRVFFCTANAGLWDNTYSAGTGWGSTWTRE